MEEIGGKYALRSNWRYEILRVRAAVGAIEWKIGSKEKWQAEWNALMRAQKPPYLARTERLVARRREILEYLERCIYRVGTQCHVLNIDMEYQPWREWISGHAPKPAAAPAERKFQA